MKQFENGQVQLSKLIFTHNWEDPAVDEKALSIQKGDNVFVITSGGCNALGFLRFAPADIFAVDINPAQTYLLELKKACFMLLDYEEATGFFGLNAERHRWISYKKIESALTSEAVSFFESNPQLIRDGLIMNGRYEKFVKLAGRMLRLMQGTAKTRKLFQLNSLPEQQLYFTKHWNNARWRWVFNTMFNKRRLAKKGLNADYFHFDDGSASFSESFQKRAAHALTEIPLRSNYFLSLYLQGKYNDADQLPEYLKQQHFPVIKSQINNIHPITADSKYWLEQQPDNFFNAIALSNICELMDDHDTSKLFTEVARTARPGARIIFRNLMIPREVPGNLQSVIVKDEALSKELQFTDRSFVYGKVAAYTVRK